MPLILLRLHRIFKFDNLSFPFGHLGPPKHVADSERRTLRSDAHICVVLWKITCSEREMERGDSHRLQQLLSSSFHCHYTRSIFGDNQSMPHFPPPQTRNEAQIVLLLPCTAYILGRISSYERLRERCGIHATYQCDLRLQGATITHCPVQSLAARCINIALPIEAFPGSIAQKHDPPPPLLLGMTMALAMMKMTSRRNALEVASKVKAAEERLSALGEDLLCGVRGSFKNSLFWWKSAACQLQILMKHHILALVFVHNAGSTVSQPWNQQELFSSLFCCFNMKYRKVTGKLWKRKECMSSL